ncbi:hypothetical protein GBSOP10_10679 [Armatimonadetes bacterium GBS]|jgi:hypothetical protein|nr:MAG: hypothetical protein KatS3mg021_2515 [Fimbriimonadales bacterium]CUU10333.1 hypothetical protein GBSOP10_10679 [Armatimonadetes bacterium GBS]
MPFNWFLRRRPQSKRVSEESRNPEVVSFWREHGVIGYALTFPDDYHRETFFSQLPEHLLSSGLAWCWQSGRDAPLAPDSPIQYLPEKRPLTRLTRDNKQELSDEFRERDIEGYGRFITIIGCDMEAVETLLDVSQMRQALKAFADTETPPVRMVLNQITDSAAVHIFVPHRPVQAIQNLLWVFEIPTWVRQVRPYRQLWGAKLEEVPLITHEGEIL